MRPAIRTQADEKGDAVSLANRTPANLEQQARQEFKEETSIGFILSRYGLVNRRPAQYGAIVDDRIDLQSAMTALDQLRGEAFDVPKELKDKYPTWRHILNASETGEYQKDLAEVAAQREAAKAENDRRQAIIDAHIAGNADFPKKE